MRQTGVNDIIKGMQTEANIALLQSRGDLDQAQANKIRTLLPLIEQKDRAIVEGYIDATVAGQKTKVNVKDLLTALGKMAGVKSTREMFNANMTVKNAEFARKMRKLKDDELKSEDYRLSIAEKSDANLLKKPNAYEAGAWADSFNRNSNKPYIWVKTGTYRHKRFDLSKLNIPSLHSAREFYREAMNRKLTTIEDLLEQLGFEVK